MSGGGEARTLGQWGEEQVAEKLRCGGWTIIARNFRCRMGEIDIVAENGRFLAFVEVKLRKDGDFAAAREAVTKAKQRRLRVTAEYYLQWHPTRLQPRFDVAEVYAPKDAISPEITYLENAF